MNPALRKGPIFTKHLHFHFSQKHPHFPLFFTKNTPMFHFLNKKHSPYFISCRRAYIASCNWVNLVQVSSVQFMSVVQSISS